MNSYATRLLLAVVLVFGMTGLAAADSQEAVVGSWTLDLAKSRFSPGPAPKSQTRTYAATADGLDMTVTGVGADGKAVSQHSTFKYDGKDYAISGSPDYDSLTLKRVDDWTIESVQKLKGKPVGKTTRTVSKDGKALTLSSKGTSATGVPYDNVMVFDRK
jgi:hypothetical protein